MLLGWPKSIYYINREPCQQLNLSIYEQEINRVLILALHAYIWKNKLAKPHMLHFEKW